MSQPYTLPCGTHAGLTLHEVLERHPEYLEQCVKTALLLEQLPAIHGLIPRLPGAAVRPPASPPPIASDTSNDPRHVTQDPSENLAAEPAPLIDLSCSTDTRPPPRTVYDDLRDIVFPVPGTESTSVPPSSTASGYSLGRSDTPDAVQQLQMLYPDASSTAIQLLYQLLPIYPNLTMDTLCVQCGQPFSRHQGLSCPTLLTGAFIPSTTTLAHRV